MTKYIDMGIEKSQTKPTRYNVWGLLPEFKPELVGKYKTFQEAREACFKQGFIMN